MSPGFEVNDAGYSTQTDRAGGHAMIQFRKLTPDGWTRERSWWVSKWWTWNYGSELQGDGWQTGGSFQFRNFWRSVGRCRVREARVGRQADAWRSDGDPAGQPSARSSRSSPTTRRSRWSAPTRLHVARLRRVAFTAGTSLVLAADAGVHRQCRADHAPQRRRGAVPLDGGRPARDRDVRPPLRLRRAGPERSVDGRAAERRDSRRAPRCRCTCSRWSRPATTAPSRKWRRRARSTSCATAIDAGSTITAGPGGQGLVIDPDGAGPASPFSIAQPDFTVRSLRPTRSSAGSSVRARRSSSSRRSSAATWTARGPSTWPATPAASSAPRPTMCCS